jgi:hypothetical protein
VGSVYTTASLKNYAATVDHYRPELRTGADSARVAQRFVFEGVVELARRETGERVGSPTRLFDGSLSRA